MKTNDIRTAATYRSFENAARAAAQQPVRFMFPNETAWREAPGTFLDADSLTLRLWDVEVHAQREVNGAAHCLWSGTGVRFIVADDSVRPNALNEARARIFQQFAN
jgi:hypothetical protein